MTNRETTATSAYFDFHVALKWWRLRYRGKEIDRAEAFIRWPGRVSDIKNDRIEGLKAWFDFNAEKQARMPFTL